MLSRRRVTFFLGGEEIVERKGKTRDCSSPKLTSTSANPTGLRILIERSRGQPNILCKSTMTWKKHGLIKYGAQLAPPSFTSGDFEYQSLTTCHLCHKRLSSNKDIFMYRGDQGFCSEECRSRQIFLDEMKEIEASTKTMLSSSPCRSSNKRVREFGRRRLL